MHLIALVEKPDHVCCRYRLSAFRARWARAGHSLDVQAFPRKPWHWFGVESRLAAADAVIVQRKLLSRWQIFLLRQNGRRLLFDYDDAVLFRDSYHARGVHCLRRQRRFATTIMGCDAVVAGNNFLRLQALPWIDPERAVVIPTCVEPADYPVAKHDPKDAIELVWIGSSSTLQGIEKLRPMLEEIGRRVPKVRLKLICDRFLRLNHLQVKECPWTAAGEKAELAAADVGISWLPDDDWSRGKCGLKVLQYQAAGLPVIANAVGVQKEMIAAGASGFLCDSVDEWVEAVARLARAHEMRRQMGQAGRAGVQTTYSVNAGAERWLTLLEQLGRMQRRAA